MSPQIPPTPFTPAEMQGEDESASIITIVLGYDMAPLSAYRTLNF